MSDEHTSTLQGIGTDRDWWLRDSGAHYRELAAWLRAIAAKCRLPNPQQELLRLARQYERRAVYLVLRVSHMIQLIRVGTGRRAVSSQSAANHLSDSVQ